MSEQADRMREKIMVAVNRWEDQADTLAEALCESATPDAELNDQLDEGMKTGCLMYELLCEIAGVAPSR